MSRWLSSIDRASALRRMALFTIAALLVIGCAPSKTNYELHELISMGPWTFTVTEAREQTEYRPGIGSLKHILVTLELKNYLERHDRPFDDFLEGDRKGSIVSRPAMWLLDGKGKKVGYPGLVQPLSGGSMRSMYWKARFELADVG